MAGQAGRGSEHSSTKVNCPLSSGSHSCMWDEVQVHEISFSELVSGCITVYNHTQKHLCTVCNNTEKISSPW